MISGRWIPLESHLGSLNMAIDQAILESDHPGPTLRFYGWSAPTLSLGYFQKLGDRALHKESLELTVLRRSTGGGAIVHDHELTYSLVVPTQSQRELFLSASNLGAATGVYDAVHQSVIDALAQLGVNGSLHKHSLSNENQTHPPYETEQFLCFQRRSEWDVTVSGYKVLGSAQRRVRGKILQHGSLLLRASSFAPQLPGIAEFTGKEPLSTELALNILSKLGARLGIRWSEGSLSNEERNLSTTAQEKCYADQEWTGRR